MDPQSLAIWLTVSATLNIATIMAIAIGSIWSAFRELHIRDERSKSTVAMNDVAGSISKLTLVGDMITQRISEMTHLSKEERRDLIDMLREYKREQVDLLTDIEKRLAHSIEISRHGHGHADTNVNIHGGSHGTQIGNGNLQR